MMVGSFLVVGSSWNWSLPDRPPSEAGGIDDCILVAFLSLGTVPTDAVATVGPRYRRTPQIHSKLAKNSKNSKMVSSEKPA